MNTPSLDSPAQLMSCISPACDVGHRALETPQQRVISFFGRSVPPLQPEWAIKKAGSFRPRTSSHNEASAQRLRRIVLGSKPPDDETQ